MSLVEQSARRLTIYSDAVALGGAEQSAANLIANLGDRYQVSVLGVDKDVAEWLATKRPGTTALVIQPVRSKFDLPRILAHIRAVKTLNPDIFQANLPTTFSCQYGLLAARLSRVKAVIAVEHSPISSHSALQRYLKRRMSARLDAHISVGVRSAREVERAAGLAEGSVRTIYNGVSDRGAPAHKAEGDLVIGSLGRLSPEKGYDLLLQAAASFESLEGVRIVLVGDGPERAALRALAKALKIADRIEFAGWRENARDYLRDFDIFVLPSRFEALPLTAAEAMLASLPIVASDVGSVPEVVLDGESGLLVPAGDVAALARALRELIVDPAGRRRMGERGLLHARELFTIDSMVSSYEALYEELLA